MDPITAVMLVLLVVLAFFIFRNSRKRRREQSDLQTKMVPGVEIMLTFGLYGTLISVNDEDNIAEVEIAPGTVIRVHRQTLGRVVEPVVAESVDGTITAASTTATSTSSTPDSTTPSYSLNEDHAISSTDPEVGQRPAFGERVDLTKSRDADADADKN